MRVYQWTRELASASAVKQQNVALHHLAAISRDVPCLNDTVTLSNALRYLAGITFRMSISSQKSQVDEAQP